MSTLGTFVYWPFYEPGAPGQNLLAIRLKLSGSAYSPNSTGVDAASVAVVPWSPVDDVTPITWTITDVFARCETPGTSESSVVRVQYSIGAGDFVVAGTIDSGGVVIPAGENESTRPAALAVTSAPSGWLFRSDWTTLDATIAGLSVYVVLYAETS